MVGVCGISPTLLYGNYNVAIMDDFDLQRAETPTGIRPGTDGALSSQHKALRPFPHWNWSELVRTSRGAGTAAMTETALRRRAIVE
jgi:hypothetical protein